jgi:hypothetical protein
VSQNPRVHKRTKTVTTTESKTEEGKDLPRVIEFSAPQRPDDLVPFADLVGKIVTIRGFEEFPSRFGGGTFAQIYGELEDGTTFTTRTSARALLDRLKRYQNDFAQGLLLKAKIVKRRGASGRYYYDLAPPRD